MNTLPPEENSTRLARQITELAAHIHAATYQLLGLIREFDAAAGWEGFGMMSCAHWLNWRCGLSLGAAREKVRVAHALPALPQISTAFEQGMLSYSKVRAMTRVATPENEPELMNIALHGAAPAHPCARGISASLHGAAPAHPCARGISASLHGAAPAHPCVRGISASLHVTPAPMPGCAWQRRPQAVNLSPYQPPSAIR